MAESAEDRGRDGPADASADDQNVNGLFHAGRVAIAQRTRRLRQWTQVGASTPSSSSRVILRSMPPA